jgi:hypothetical protein
VVWACKVSGFTGKLEAVAEEVVVGVSRIKEGGVKTRDEVCGVWRGSASWWSIEIDVSFAYDRLKLLVTE